MTTIAPLARVAFLLALFVPIAVAQTPPPVYVVNDVRLVDQPDAPRVTLLLRDGRIAGILEEPHAAVPGARRIDGRGFLALPAFIDAYSHHGVTMPEPTIDRDQPPSTESDVRVEMRTANRKGIQPAFRAVDAVSEEENSSEPWRKAGFGVLHVAPRGELLAGTSAVLTAREAAVRDRVLRPSVFHAATWSASGGRGYPNTLMGYHAQLRQFLHDALHHAALQQRRTDGKAGARPPYDRDLEAAIGLVRGSESLVCDADREADIRRWLRIADEFGLSVAIAGGREAHELVGVLAARRVPVLMTLDWEKEVPDPDAKKKGDKAPKDEPTDATPGAEPETQETPEKALEKTPAKSRPGAADSADDAWIYEEPLELRRERRRLWEETRRGALRLHEGGVRLAFGTGSAKPGDLLKRVRTLVEEGLPRAAALDALTRGGAELLGVGDRVGRIEVGYDAHLALWTASPFDDKARVAWIVIDGVPQEFEVEAPPPVAAPDEGLDASGVWTLVFEGSRATEPTILDLEMAEDGSVQGSIRFFSPFAAEEVRGEVKGEVSGGELRLDARLQISGFDVETTFSGELEGDTYAGEAVWRFSQGEQKTPFTATRDSEEDPR